MRDHGHCNGIRGHSGVLTPRCEVLRRFRESASAASENASRRTVADLLGGAAHHLWIVNTARPCSVEQQARQEAFLARDHARVAAGPGGRKTKRRYNWW